MSIPAGLCQCGCGSKTRIAPQSKTAYGWVKGQPIRFVKGHSGGNRGSGWTHGTHSTYALGCRCRPCKDAKNRYYRERRRKAGGGLVPVEEARDQVACLLAFGVEHIRIAAAMGSKGHGVYLRGRRIRAGRLKRLRDLHWGAWRASGPFRRHCQCDVPTEVLDSLERVA